jgi:hypothetical protein
MNDKPTKDNENFGWGKRVLTFGAIGVLGALQVATYYIDDFPRHPIRLDDLPARVHTDGPDTRIGGHFIVAGSTSTITSTT